MNEIKKNEIKKKTDMNKIEWNPRLKKAWNFKNL